jgi:hypothetical protein
VTVFPCSSRSPAPGIWSVTVPRGSVDELSPRMSTRNPAARIAWIASERPMPTTSGTAFGPLLIVTVTTEPCGTGVPASGVVERT